MRITSHSLKENDLVLLTEKVKSLKIPPHLVVILIGDNSASKTYVGHKERIARQIGATITIERLPATVSPEHIKRVIAFANAEPTIHGILLQLPLPTSLIPHTREFIECIDPLKDIDGLTSYNMGNLIHSPGSGLTACTPQAVMRILTQERGDLSGKNMVIIGRSEIVGKPLFHLALAANMSVMMLHSHSQDIAQYTKNADIIVVAVGRVAMLTDSDVSDGALIIDVGINHHEGRLVGDAEISDTERVDVTAVPGGVGPMTVVYVMHNLLSAYEMQINSPSPSYIEAQNQHKHRKILIIVALLSCSVGSIITYYSPVISAIYRQFFIL